MKNLIECACCGGVLMCVHELRQKYEKLKAAQAAGLAALATRLGLLLPPDYDPYYAIGLDIGRLQEVERLWSQACQIARVHCPVEVGRSHIRDGIPALAERAKSAELLAAAQAVSLAAWERREMGRL